MYCTNAFTFQLLLPVGSRQPLKTSIFIGEDNLHIRLLHLSLWYTVFRSQLTVHYINLYWRHRPSGGIALLCAK